MTRGDLIPQSHPEDDIFDMSGPTHVPPNWWINHDYKRSVAASLVKAVYILEQDRCQGIQWSDSLAPPWCNKFGFTMIRKLEDENSEIFGAIYEFQSPRSTNEIPHYVFAFRGTILSSSNDMKHNVDLIRNELHRTDRIRIATQAVENHITVNNSDVVNWLVGHSLGAATAMLVVKLMAIAGYGTDCLKSYLFNPPFISFPFFVIKNEKINHGVKALASLVTAGFGVAAEIKHRKKNPKQVQAFTKLKDWVPDLFVNDGDIICKGYIEWFAHREWMKKKKMGKVERFATRHGTLGALKSILSEEFDQTVHIIPSANLTVNSRRYHGFVADHKLRQWWSPDLNMPQPTTYMYE